MLSDAARGLTDADAAQRLAEQGSNSLSTARRRTAMMIFFSQFRSIIPLLLLAATVISWCLGDHYEALAILLVIALNAALGFFTEWQAEKALSSLRKQAQPQAEVIRAGRHLQVPATDLVTGDLVVLSAGIRVPADGRLVQSIQLQIEESTLTGESLAVNKNLEAVVAADATLGDRFNLAFLGTAVTAGRGLMLVTATGAKTEAGHIGSLLDAAEDRATPLEQKLNRLGRVLLLLVAILCAIIVLVGWLRGGIEFWAMMTIGLSLAIAAVPEGLPAVATMTLALGMRRMARRGALVRRLPAVETLGATTVICADKTGTLTRNEMSVCALFLGSRRIEITGVGFGLAGGLKEDGQPLTTLGDEHLQLALRIGVLCNDAKIDRFTDGSETVLGDPTEAALIVAAEKAGMKPSAQLSQYPRLREIPFDSDSQRMITVHRTPQGRILVLIKGAPAVLLSACSTQYVNGAFVPLDEAARNQWLERNHLLANAALRVLGLAYLDLAEDSPELDFSKGLGFVGLVAMSDPLRPEAAIAIATCRKAGIRTVMITGDQVATATGIARQLGLDTDLKGRSAPTVHGRDLAKLDDAGWARAVQNATVFARVSPEQKLRIVEALQRQGHIVAMTGDGVNDAPAMKTADIGIAMGKSSALARDNADMVITDDNFSSIVSAVREGRIIYGNILRFLRYILSCNFSEILVIFAALLLGWPLPLVALQILWLNLVTDTFPAFALALEPASPGVMRQPPRDPSEALLSRRFLGLIAWQGLLLAAATLLAYGIGLSRHGSDGEGLKQATTMAFMTLALVQIFHAFSARSHVRSIFGRGSFSNRWLWGATAVCLLLQATAISLPPLQRLLHTVPPSLADWAVILTCSLLPLLLIEFFKNLRRRSQPKGKPIP